MASGVIQREKSTREAARPGSSVSAAFARAGRPRRHSHWPIITVFFAWLMCSGARSAWERYKEQPARLVARFEYYLARWGVAAQESSSQAQLASLLPDLCSTQPIRRWQAAERLADRAAAGATPALIAALKDEAGTERTCLIAHNLGRIGDRTAVRDLIRAVEHPSNTDLRVCATIALGDIGDTRALEPLIAAYRTRGSLVALHSIGYLGDPRAVPFLASIARTTRDRLHRHAAEHGLLLIRLLTDADAPGALVKALPELPEPSQIWAIGHLVAMGDIRAIGPLHHLARDARRNDELRICAAAALATFGVRAAAEVVSLARTGDTLSHVLGGLAARHADGLEGSPMFAAASASEGDAFVKRCLDLANQWRVKH